MAKVAVSASGILSNSPLTWQGQGDYHKQMESTTSLSSEASGDRSFSEERPGTLANVSRLADDLYFIRLADGPVKIGRSRNAERRLITLQTSSPYEMTLLGVVKGAGEDEWLWHARFASQRLRGEWFAWSAQLFAALDSVLDGGDRDAALNIGARA